MTGVTVPNQNIEISRGDTGIIFVALTGVDGSVYNPSSGAAIKWRLAPTSHATEAEVMAAKDLTNGIKAVTNGVEITLTAADTDYPADIYYHELKVYDSGDIATSLTGVFVIKPSLRMGT